MVAAAKLLGRSIKWTEDRREYFTNAVHERDQYWALEIAVDAEAKVLGIRGKLLHDTGAYTLQDPNIPYNSASTMSGPYVIADLAIDVTIAMSNKTPVSSVRGAGYPQAAFAMERLLDLVAREMKLDRAEVRRRNLIPAEKMPYQKPLKTRAGMTIQYDSGDYPACQAEVLEAAGWDEFPQRQAEARKQGRYLGIGLAHGVKGTGRGPFESGLVRISRTGRITVFTGASAMGQGLGTAWRRSRRASSASMSARSTWWPATPRASRSASAASPAGRPSPPAPRCCSRPRRSPTRPRRSPRTCWRRPSTIWSWPDGEVRVVGAPQLNVKLVRDRAHPAGRAGLRLSARRRSRPRSQRQAPHRRAVLRQRLPRRRGRGRRRDRRGARSCATSRCRTPAC